MLSEYPIGARIGAAGLGWLALGFNPVQGFSEEEWGYFVLSELESARGPLGLPIERDLHFKPSPFSQVIKQYRAERGR